MTQDDSRRSARAKPPLWLRALEAAGLLALIIGLASDTWWLAGVGFATVLLSYRLYRGPRGKVGADGAGNGGWLGYDMDGGGDGGG